MAKRYIDAEPELPSALYDELRTDFETYATVAFEVIAEAIPEVRTYLESE